jgi:hypothetical protein
MLLKNCVFFDEVFYRELYSIKNIDPRKHYKLYGEREGYITSKKNFFQLYPEALLSLNPLEMKKYHENRGKREISESISNSISSNIDSKFNSNKNTALILHIGDLNIFCQDILYYRNMILYVDVYVTVLENINIEKEDIEKYLGIKINFYKVENKGFDIYPFLFVLNHLEKKYEYIIKSHTKTIQKWRIDLLKIFRYLPDIFKIFEDDKNKTIGIIGCKDWIYDVKENLEVNRYHLNKLIKTKNNNLYDAKFVAGTIFIARFCIFKDILAKELKEFNFNNEYSLDINWYRLNKVHPDLNLQTDIDVMDHYIENNIDNFKNFSPNLLHKIKNPETKSRLYRDGMFEHAFERYFGILCFESDKIVLGMENINYIQKYDISFVPIIFPQFHEIPENNKFWGKGFTEWTLLKKTEDNFGQKIRKPHSDIGYYDLTSLTHRKKISNISTEYGLDAFCFYHYWFGYPVMNKPAELMLQEGHPNKPFFFNWANETWTRRWDGIKNGEILLEQKYEYEMTHFNYLLKFFRSDKYLKIDNKPIFAIYRMEEKVKEIIDLWNLLAQINGFNGIFFIQTLGHFSESNDNFKEFDGQIEFEPGYSSSQYNSEMLIKDITDSIFYKDNDEIYNEEIYLQKNPDVKEMVQNGVYKDGKDHYDRTGEVEKMYRNYKCLKFDIEKTYALSLEHERKSKYRFPTIFMNWNNSPRRTNPSIFINGSFELFESHLFNIITKIFKDPNPDNNIILINAFNEFNEQAILEPTDIDEYKYLEIIKKIKIFFSF